MINHKLGVYALLLEINAWSGPLLLNSSSDAVLLWYLTAHAGASALLGFFAWSLLPAHASKPRVPAILLMASISYAIPLAGFAGVVAGALMLRYYQRKRVVERFSALELPEYDPHQREQGSFGQAGLRSVLGNARVPMSSRLGAMVALQYVPGRVASPLLRDVLSDPNEDIRLLAYGMLDNQEKRINRSIDEELRRFEANSTDGQVHNSEAFSAAQRLSDHYWELVYQELAQGDLRKFSIDRSMHYCDLALTHDPDHAPLNLRRGRLLQELGQAEEAAACYRRARALGLPATRVLPYQAELSFKNRDYAETQRVMQELANWSSLPRLRPLIEYWTES